uniref:Uncharacterized protein n=1 Tax=Anguilla anguilla TaxID=7936 RepID=A0A0E9U053_ANGAN
MCLCFVIAPLYAIFAGSVGCDNPAMHSNAMMHAPESKKRV